MKTSISKVQRNSLLLLLIILWSLFQLKITNAKTLAISNLAWSIDGSRLAIGYENGKVVIQSASTHQVQWILSAHEAKIDALEWSPDDKYLASADANNSLYIWNTRNGQLVATTQDIRWGNFMSLAWSPNGSRIVGITDSILGLRVWNPMTGDLLGAYTGIHPIDIAWEPNGAHLAGALPAYAVKLVDTKTFDYQTADHLRAGTNQSLYSVAWSHDSSMVAAGSFDGQILVWQMPSKKLLYKFIGTEIQNPTLYDATIRGVAFSNDGQELVTASQDGIISVWNLRTGQLSDKIKIQSGITILTLTIDGSRIAYVNNYGLLKTRMIPIESQPARD